VTYLNGTGSFKERNSITVSLPDGKTQEVPWDRLILATGTRPFELPGLPFDGRRILSSNHALELRDVPESLLIVGGGVIGCEFAFLFSSLGSAVTVVEALSRMLPLFSVDEDCSKVLEREMKKRKIRFMVNRIVKGVDDVDGRLRVTIGPSPFGKAPVEKEEETLFETADRVLVCVGRTPNTAQIKGFETLGVTLDEKGWVQSDSRMETSVPDIYAVGDVLGPDKIMLAHVASAEGLTAAENAAGGRRRMDYGAVPGAIFTSPEVADVGLTEAQARDQGIPARTETVLFRALGKAHVIGEIAGQAKIVSEKGTGRVLGVHIIGPHATDLIAEATLAVKLGATVEDLSHTIHAHPTLAEIVQETALKAMDRSLHG
jgi:dihydrolipoamide dehydrogenase